MGKRFEIHSHTMYSNLRLADSTSKPVDLINRAIEIGLAGICITDHECLSASIQINKYAKELKETHPDFKVGIGNEIYLVDERPAAKHYHFILVAKDKIGHRQLKELSSLAWMNSYFANGHERVDTLKSDLEAIVNKNKGHLIASTACLGSELDILTLGLIKAEKAKDETNRVIYHNKIINFILWCKNLFGEDFYIECQPAKSKDQIAVNGRLLSIAKCFNVKMIVTTDSHYLRKEDRFVHKAFLTSKPGEREVDAFYEYAYLQTYEEIIDNLKASNYDELFVEEMFKNSLEIYDKIEFYDLTHTQQIPKVDVKDYPKTEHKELSDYPKFASMFESDDKINRYWANQCLEGLKREFKDFPNIDKRYYEELEEETDVKQIISKKLNTNMFGYPVLLQHYIDLIWSCGSTIGAGRGSACSALNHYLLGITQLDPIEWNFPFFRYMNRDTDGLGDIDIDVCPSVRPVIINKIKEERSHSFKSDIDELSKNNLGCTLIATFGTETTKNAIQTGCRGYRSEEFPDGIDIDTAQYLSSLIPQERGFLWSLSDVINGNPEKGRQPVTTFLNEIRKYDGLLDIIKGIEGLVSSRGIHASGIIMFDSDPYENCCFMRSTNGDIITQYDLHDAEAAGMTKLDFLVTEVQDKITETIKILQKKNKIDSSLSLREAYDKYLHPKVLDINDEKVWRVIQRAASLDLFQLDSEIGRQGAKKVRPTNMIELSSTNGLIRLMGEKDKETPMDKYCRFKANPDAWYREMDSYGLSEKEKSAIIPYLKDTCGIGISQEQLMRVLMDKDICDFTLKEANAARKIVSKKKMNKIAEFKEKVWATAKSEYLAQYVWDSVVAPGLGYSFSDIHSLSYSFIGYQTAYLATKWNPIYWNTACLIVNSGSLEDKKEEVVVNIYEEEDPDEEYEDLPDRSGKKKKSTDYTKLATAIGKIREYGIKVSLIDINSSNFGFEADDVNNEIIFGLKGANKVGDDVARQIIQGRPYTGIIDFMNRCPQNKTVMISLIKAGAFDKLDNCWASKLDKEPRKAIMAYYISTIADTKSKLNLQNFNGLIKKNLLPGELEDKIKVYNFNKYLKTRKANTNYAFDNACLTFYSQRYNPDNLSVVDGNVFISQKVWDGIYQTEMDAVRDWLNKNQKEVLNRYNISSIKETWEKSASGTIPSWEMESLCFYHSKHELDEVDTIKYGISNFFELQSESIEKFYNRGGRRIPIYNLYRIIGTVISKNDTRSMVTLLTTTGVVSVKFTKDQYAKYKRQISRKNEEGKKKIIEKSWFTRGRKLMITGFRREDQFVAKTYSSTPTHQIYLITEVNGSEISLKHERALGDEEM